MTKTYHQIQKEIEKLQKEAERLREKEAADVAARIREAIAVYGFTVADLFGDAAGRKAAVPGRKAKTVAARVPLAAKYKDDQGNTWSGRGPRPGWFKAALDAGKSEADLLA